MHKLKLTYKSFPDDNLFRFPFDRQMQSADGSQRELIQSLSRKDENLAVLQVTLIDFPILVFHKKMTWCSFGLVEGVKFLAEIGLLVQSI